MSRHNFLEDRKPLFIYGKNQPLNWLKLSGVNYIVNSGEKLVELIEHQGFKQILTRGDREIAVPEGYYHIRPNKSRSWTVLKLTIGGRSFYIGNAIGMLNMSEEMEEETFSGPLKQQQLTLQEITNYLNRNEITSSIGGAVMKAFLQETDRWLAPRQDDYVSQELIYELRNYTGSPGYIYNSDPGQVHINVRAYDVNSLYPFYASRLMVPMGKGTIEFDNEDEPIYEFDFNPYLCYYITVKIEGITEWRGAPLLNPLRGLMGKKQRYFSEGTSIVTNLNDKELEYVREYSDAKITIYKVVSYRACNWWCRDFIDHLYETKKNASSKLERSIAKQWLNYFVGKIGSKHGKGPGINPIIQRYLVASCRVLMCRVINVVQEHGYKVYYCDTDSIHTNCPPEVFDDMFGTLGDEMGQFKIEHSFKRVIYKATKTYIGIDGSDIVCKLAGVREIDRSPHIEEFIKQLKLQEAANGFKTDKIIS